MGFALPSASSHAHVMHRGGLPQSAVTSAPDLDLRVRFEFDFPTARKACPGAVRHLGGASLDEAPAVDDGYLVAIHFFLVGKVNQRYLRKLVSYLLRYLVA